MSDRAAALIDLSAVHHNVEVVRHLVGPDRKLIAMIKANAYGHGILPVANALSKDVGMLGVATVYEAVVLREANITLPILVLTGFITAEELDLFFHYQLTSVIHHPLQLELLEQSRAEKTLPVFLKLDTGMHRLGFSVDAFANAFQRLSNSIVVQQPIQLMTHLADADNPDPEFTESQLALFSKVTRSLPGEKSIANSAGILVYPTAFVDIVRPGLMLYGVSPFADRVGAEFRLKPVMQLQSKLIAVKKIKKGDKVGYSCTWECPEDMRLGVVGMGYGDGYPRHVPNGTPVLIHGIRCPIVGRVSMDMITVDLRKLSQVDVGDQVIFWGPDLPVETIALAAETIPYELLCQLTQRVRFGYGDSFE